MSRRLLIALLVILVPLAFVAGRWLGRGGASTQPGGRTVLYYVDPMNPAFRSPTPGTAPCGMPLEPVYSDGGGAVAGSALPAGAVSVRPDRQQLIGVQTAAVSHRPGARSLRLLGRVAPDELRLFRLSSVTAGWVREVSGPTTGSLVRKNEKLGTYYSQELTGPQQAFVYALDALDRFRESGANEQQIEINERNVANARQVLLNLGMSEPQIQAVADSRQIAPLVEMRAPGSGVVLARNVALGQRFDPYAELFVIADLSRVWILADAFEGDEEILQPGLVARVAVPATGRTLQATVSRALPQFDPATRTLKVRLEAANPDLALRPGMFVDVEVEVETPPALVVPASAVLDSGSRRTVFVAQGEGTFVPRAVTTGRRYGAEVEILSGLEAGEAVVVAGNFLLDSESRMRSAGTQAPPATAPKAPDAAGAAGATADAIDPICGMAVDPAEARAAGLVSEHGGRSWFFCNPGCKKRFDVDPAAALAKAAPAAN
jgi:Cu(I)/Ag(I) efflux system membrane fusion protein